jgi:hypothetical protein
MATEGPGLLSLRAILRTAAADQDRSVIGDNLNMYGRFYGARREDSPLPLNNRKGRIWAQMASFKPDRQNPDTLDVHGNIAIEDGERVILEPCRV